MSRKPLKLSEAVAVQLDRISADRVVVAAVMTVSLEQAKALKHAGLEVENGALGTSEPAPPPRTCGFYARRNLGWREKRKDLLKIDREIS